VAHTLLLADDSVTIQRVIELTFADEDVQVVAVSDGDQAIARLESAPPDIVLADIGMPGRDGYEVARYVKQSPKLSHIPVVLLTGAFEPVDQARASEVGCDGVLAKPFEPQLVIGRVRELLSSEARKPTAPVAAAAPARQPAAPAAAPTPVASSTASTSSTTPTPAPAEPAVTPVEAPADLDDYFDRLDVAFAKLSASAPPAKPVKAPDEIRRTETFQPPAAAEPAASVAEQIDWYASRQQSDVPEPPVSYASPEPALGASPFVAAPKALAPPAVEPQSVAPQPSSARSHEVPTLREAFAAILAAESGGAGASGPAWPATMAAPEPPTIEVSPELIDLVAKRVLEQLSDRVVRETTHEIVAQVAERLVREEIDRIKSALK
jgi:CheY-like chemotaxis protein